MSKFDVIILGASGFTGKHVVEEIARLSTSPSTPFTWAVAGRSKAKLERVLRDVASKVDIDASKIQVLVVELNNFTAMMEIAGRTAVLINCIGPYTLYGERAIQGCLLGGCDYIDLNAEIQSVEKLHLQYGEEAKLKNIHIIPSCGLECIPLDCGVAYMQKTFGGEINSVETYLEINTSGKKIRISKGPWLSIVTVLANPFAHWDQQKKLYPKPLPKPKFSLPWRWPLHYNQALDGWCALAPLAPNISAMNRSQYYNFHEKKQRPIQFRYYFKRTLSQLVTLAYSAFLFFMMAQLSFGREFLVKFADFFTNGMVSDRPPTKEELEDTDLRMTLMAEGWDRKVKFGEEHDQPPNKKQKLTVTIKEPIYRGSAIMIAQAAISLLIEKDKIPPEGGVYTPGVAFADTTIIDRLNSRGLSFKIA